jgi:hypothetical protein
VEYVAISKLKPRKSIIRLMHIELQPDKRYYSIGEIAKAFDVNASIRFGTVFDILKPKAKGNRMFTLKTSKFATYLSSGKEFTLEGAKIHLKEGQRRHWINLKLSGS